MYIPFMYNFQGLSNKFPTIFLNLIFHISAQGLSCFAVGFFLRKQEPKILGFENAMERGIWKIVTFEKL